ncbi:hypothetical protein Ocin01_19728 [Orchesella cincta]|uniref:Uncharacterized protein n=1 Tax=Orchesella cincta TaxID=48709 RepID=A0A1D2M1X3_ORCCI|nr:hypothetical protein Ocin01_19728 [Orchesella cincta]
MVRGLPRIDLKLAQKLGGRQLSLQIHQPADLDKTWKNMLKEKYRTLGHRSFHQRKQWNVANGVISDFIDSFKVCKDVYNATIVANDESEVSPSDMTLRERTTRPSYAESEASMKAPRNRNARYFRNLSRIGKATVPCQVPRRATRGVIYFEPPANSTVPVNRNLNSSNVAGPSRMPTSGVVPGTSRSMFPPMSQNEEQATTSRSTSVDSEVLFIEQRCPPPKKTMSLTLKRPSDNQAQQPLYKTMKIGESSEVGTRQASTHQLHHDSRSDLLAAGIVLKDVKTEALRNFKNVDNDTVKKMLISNFKTNLTMSRLT